MSPAPRTATSRMRDVARVEYVCADPGSGRWFRRSGASAATPAPSGCRGAAERSAGLCSAWRRWGCPRAGLEGVAPLGDHLCAAFALDEPDVVDRVLDPREAGARGKHPAREDPPVAVFERHLVDLDEGGRVRALGRRAAVAHARRQLQGAELNGLVGRDLERDDAARDLVEARENGGRVLDPVGLGRSGQRGRCGQGQGEAPHRHFHAIRPRCTAGSAPGAAAFPIVPRR